jgi:protein-tyrosine phosphatase
MYEIVKGLWLGDVNDAACDADLDKNGIGVIAYAEGVETRRVEVEDDRNDVGKMTEALPAVVEFVDSRLKQGVSVLVHCRQGRQYLMRSRSLSVKDAIKVVKAGKRDAFFPFVNFQESLSRFTVR